MIYSSLGSHIPNLPKTSDYFAKTSCQNNDFFRAIAEVSQTPKILRYNSF